MGKGLQISASNPIPGLESRAALLQSLGKSLEALPEIFGKSGRPGNLVGNLSALYPPPAYLSNSTPDYLIASASGSKTLDVKTLWKTLQSLLIPIWPKDRTSIGGVAIGDAWPLEVLKTGDEEKDHFSGIQPFHKLTQWLTYSLMVPFDRILGYKWENAGVLTGLPEYRNGGLFVDMGVLSLKPDSQARGLKLSGENLPMFEAGDDVIVEWRAMTVSLLDALYQMILKRIEVNGHPVELSMAQVLESGTWKAGRELAAEHRPETKSSPIVISSDGTVF